MTWLTVDRGGTCWTPR